jgi:hypothetical protein
MSVATQSSLIPHALEIDLVVASTGMRDWQLDADGNEPTVLNRERTSDRALSVARIDIRVGEDDTAGVVLNHAASPVPESCWTPGVTRPVS